MKHCLYGAHTIQLADPVTPTGSACLCGEFAIMATDRDPDGRLAAITIVNQNGDTPYCWICDSECQGHY